MKAGSAPILIMLLIAGCGTIEQKVKPITLSGTEAREICVIENTSVRKDFLTAYRDALSRRNLTVRVLPPETAVGSCPLTSTYTANWRWDLALYLAFADLKVYRNGRLEGEAVYDSLQAGAKTSKFINAGMKIQELTDQLFPD